jgi:hypothetical protein
MKRLLIFAFGIGLLLTACNNKSATGNGSAIADTVKAPPVDSPSHQ